MVSEIIKHRTNQGEHGGVFFYRDQHGTEGDLVIEHGSQYVMVEAKSGQTISDDTLSAARRIKTALEDVAPCRAVVAYGGQARQARHDVLLLPWGQIDREHWVR